MKGVLKKYMIYNPNKTLAIERTYIQLSKNKCADRNGHRYVQFFCIKQQKNVNLYVPAILSIIK